MRNLLIWYFMFKNYFTTAFRNLVREKNTSLLNIAGLTLGITCSLILFLIISYHRSFDQFHAKKDRIFRIVSASNANNRTDYQPGVPAVLPDAFRMDFPEVEKAVFTSYLADALVVIPANAGEDKKFREEAGVVYTEPGYFRLFDRQFVSGSAESAIDEPNEAVIAESLALKYFGKTDVAGEVLRVAGRDYKISGVVKDAPSNTDLPFNLILSYITVKTEREKAGWGSIWSDEQFYFMLRDGEEISSVQSKLAAFIKKHVGEDDLQRVYHVQALTEMHYDDRYETYTYRTVSKGVLGAYGVIAFILVLIASINFINLTTAEAIKRSREVGVRKVLGSTRTQLMVQFLGETLVVTVVAVILALALTQLLLGFINPFMELHLALNFSGNISLYAFLIALTAGVALLSGLYPAFVLSGFKPALALKNSGNNRSSSAYFLRGGLVVLQFFISQVFIIGTIILIRQINYFTEKDLGFSKEAIVVIEVPDLHGLDEKSAAVKRKNLRDEMMRIPGVELASLGSAPPTSGRVSKTNASIQGVADSYQTQVKMIDGQYLDLYQLTLLGGKDLDDADTVTGYIVNEQFARTAGFQNPQDIIGTKLNLWEKKQPVIGVVKDFHTVSLENPIEPTVLMNGSNSYSSLALRINTARTGEIISAAKQKWESVYSDHIFEYQFMDESIRIFYEDQHKATTMLGFFTAIAICIGCLGLFGLATFMTNQRTKEIGVRKVMGASVSSILVIFLKEYGKLVCIGFILAAPLAAFAMQQVLNEFAYRIEIGADIFVIAFVITLLVATITVGYRSVKAAIMNPVKSLRYE